MEVTAPLAPPPFVITESSQVGEARRRIVDLAAGAGFEPGALGKLALAVNELGSNLVKHGGGGVLLGRLLERPAAMELLALDRGAGMTSVDECFRDGYSTAGSPGTGLGAVRRLASLMDVYSARGRGTAIVVRVAGARRRGSPDPSVEVGAVSVPKPGETVCGDAWAVSDDPECPGVVVADGLGHGPAAGAAAALAVRAFEVAPGRAPAAHVAAIHQALRGSRGAAVAVTCLDLVRGRVTFAGIGNVAGVVLSGGPGGHLMSSNGTAGHDVGRVHEQAGPWPDGALLVMHSDGLGTRWRLAHYPGLQARHPALIAGVLYRDWNRGNDDVTVVAVRRSAGAGAA